MLHDSVDVNTRSNYDEVFLTIADYASKKEVGTELTHKTAALCLMDSIGCAIQALQYPACTRLLGPIIPGTTVPNGSRVPGTHHVLDPILAAFNIGALVRWLDFNDTWLAAEWGHPSDNLGAILAITDYLSQIQVQQGKAPISVKEVFHAMIKAHEIQGILALENGFNRLGFDHVILVKIASTAVAAHLLGANRDQIANALSQAWIDGAALRTYRHAPNTGSRKSWAAGDATSRALRLAWLTMQGEMGYPSAMTTKKWGFNDCILRGDSIKLSQPFNHYVMDNVLFKISFPAEFHAQTAVECAIQMHPLFKQKKSFIDKIVIHTQESAVRIISKSGELHNPADRDHCLQYMIAIGLLEGKLTAQHYENKYADSHPEIDALRQCMIVQEDIQFTRDYLDPEKRSIANSLQLFFKDGTSSDKITVEYPVGHKRRREEGIPLLYNKFKQNIMAHYETKQANDIIALFQDQKRLENTSVSELMTLLVKG